MKAFLTLFSACLIVTTSFAQDWIRQNPYPKLAQLRDIHFDGEHGIATGNESVAFVTHDYGTVWTPVTITTWDQSLTSAFVIPGSGGQKMIVAGIGVWKTTNGGQSWTQIHGSLSNAYDIQWINGNTLFVHSPELSIYSTDEGENWEVISVPGNDGVTAGSFTDSQHGWVSAGNFNNVQVWVTENGGEDWSLRDETTHPVISKIIMLDNQNGFLSARDFVYKTNNGGNTWELLHQNAVNSIQDMHVVDDQNIYTALINGFLHVSHDGGDSWSEIDPAIISSNKTEGIFANTNSQIWLAGNYVSILYSSTNGQSWTDQLPNSKQILYTPHFITPEQGMIGGSAGTILWTDNGGASFHRSQLGLDENFFGAHRSSESTAWVGTSSGNVYRTTDGPNEWELTASGLGSITSIHAQDESNAMLVNENGAVWQTQNGIDWENIYNSEEGLLEDISVIGDKAWICGWFGQIYFSDNNGNNWTRQQTNSDLHLNDIHFIDDQNGWAVASSFTDSIFHTTNGGATWIKSKLPINSFWHGVSFHSPDTGWVAGGSAGLGNILRTNDGGITWEHVHQSPSAFFGISAVPGTENVWASGVGGNVVKFSPCTFSPTISSLTGETQPCQNDTIQFEALFADVDEFEWTFPGDWLILGNPNSSIVNVVAGAESGVVSLTGYDGCGQTSSPFILNVDPREVEPVTISQNGVTLETEYIGEHYQWLYEGDPIENGNESFYIPGSNGAFTLLVTQTSGCVARSNTIFYILSSTEESAAGHFKIYPNPAQRRITMTTSNDQPITEGDLRIYGVDGYLMWKGTISGNEIMLPELSKGIYIVHVMMKEGLLKSKMVIH